MLELMIYQFLYNLTKLNSAGTNWYHVSDEQIGSYILVTILKCHRNPIFHLKIHNSKSLLPICRQINYTEAGGLKLKLNLEGN